MTIADDCPGAQGDMLSILVSKTGGVRANSQVRSVGGVESVASEIADGR